MDDGIEMQDLNNNAEDLNDTNGDIDGLTSEGDQMGRDISELETKDKNLQKQLKDLSDNQKSKINEKLQKQAKNVKKFHESVRKVVENKTGVELNTDEIPDLIDNLDLTSEDEEDEKQKAVNETFQKMTKKTFDTLVDDAQNMSREEFRKKWEKIIHVVLGGTTIAGILTGLTYQILNDTKKKQTLGKLAQGASGCYQKVFNKKIGTYYVGPCRCGFKNMQGDTCNDGDPKDKLSDRVKNATFCSTSPFSNTLTTCPITQQACNFANNMGTCPKQCEPPGNQSCKDGDKNCKQCTGDQKDNLECNWIDPKNPPDGTTVLGTSAVCADPTYILSKLIILNNKYEDWVPQPTPPITIIITILGIIGIIITVLWYIIFLIRQERKMGKK